MTELIPSIDHAEPCWRYRPDPGLSPELAAWRDERFNLRLTVHDAAEPGWAALWGRLVERISAISGRPAEVIVPPERETRRSLHALVDGATLLGPPGRPVAMASNQCHSNALELAAEHDWLVGAGFVGRNGGPVNEWRRHSWCLDLADGTVVETTRAHYHRATR